MHYMQYSLYTFDVFYVLYIEYVVDLNRELFDRSNQNHLCPLLRKFKHSVAPVQMEPQLDHTTPILSPSLKFIYPILILMH